MLTHDRVLEALQKAAVNLGLQPHQMVLVSGSGCPARRSQHLGAYAIQTMHGRALPTATGVKVANPGLTVVAAGSDEDGCGIGVGHLVHAARRNVDLTYILCDKTHPEGACEWPVHPLELSLVSGATFVAQGFAGDPATLAQILEQALAHKGFALVNIHQGSADGVTAAGPDHDPTDRAAALALIRDQSETLTGILYQVSRPTHEEQLPHLPKGSPLTRASMWLGREQFDHIVGEFR